MATKDVIKLLQDCENGLRRLVSSAAAEGDYTAVIKLTSWASAVHDLAGEAKIFSNQSANDDGHNTKPPLMQTEPPVTGGRLKVSQRRLGRATSYPKFFRTAKELVKIGWSKRQRAEYQHKAPYFVLESLVSKLSPISTNGTVFSADQLIPLEAEDGTPIPDYQTYLSLAWLRHEGVVKAHGRQGYSVLDVNLSESVKAMWNELQIWRR